MFSETQTASLHNITLQEFQALPDFTRVSLQRTAPFVDQSTSFPNDVLEQRAFLLEQDAKAETWWTLLEMQVDDLYTQGQKMFNFVHSSAQFWPPNCANDSAESHPLYQHLVELRQLALHYAYVSICTGETDREKCIAAINESLLVKTGKDVCNQCFKLFKCLQHVTYD